MPRPIQVQVFYNKKQDKQDSNKKRDGQQLKKYGFLDFWQKWLSRELIDFIKKTLCHIQFSKLNKKQDKQDGNKK